MSLLKSKLLVSSMFAGVVGGMMMTPALAQEGTDADVETVAVSEAAEDDVSVQERVVVTGSRIQRDANLTSSIPVTSIGIEDIQSSGAYNIAEIIRDLPAAGVPGLTASTTNFSVFSGGLESIDLRNLGDSRTLTLINGRRVVPGVPGSSIVDFSMIPPDFIENVEVLTGGASSVYGSEAIAGVVNVVLRDDFEGVELNIRGGNAETEGGEQGRVSLTAGGLFDKGNFIVNASYDIRGGMFAGDTDYPNDEFYYSGYGFVQRPAYSTYSEYGRFDVGYGGTYGHLVYNNLTDTTEFFDDIPGAYGYNRNPNRRVLIPQERYSLAASSNYEFNPYANLSLTALYAHVSSDTDIEPFPLHSDDIYNPQGLLAAGSAGAGVPLTNAFMPQDIYDAAVANGYESVGFARRMTDVAYRTGRYDRETLDLTIGLDGDLGDTGLTYAAYINHGRSSSSRVGTGQINVQNMAFALDSIVDPVSGDIICANATARQFGCVPVNVFGIGTITPEAAGYIAAPGLRTAETEQTVVQGTISGDVFEGPAGPVGFAVGVEYRDLQSDDIVDALTAAGLNAGNAIESTVGGYDVYEAFGELLVPLVKDAGVIDNLDFEAAYRIADYSSVGQNQSWKYGITASMFDEQVRFRAIGARAARAPDIGDLYSGNSQSFTSTTDPCSGVDTTDVGSTDPLIQSCLALPGVQAALATDGVFGYTREDTQAQYIYFSGSELLEPETSDSYTIGFVFSPDMIDGLTASIDYVNFEIEDAITNLSTRRSAEFCLESGNPANPFCNNIVRDDVTSKILFGYAVPVNAALFATDGIDVQLSYAGDVPTFGNADADFGSWNGRILYGRTLSYEYTSSADAEPSDFLGDIGYPEDKFNITLGWNKGGLSLGWNTYLLSPMDFGEDDECRVYDPATGQTWADLYASFGYDGTACFIKDKSDWYAEHSINASYEVEDWGLEIYGSVDNLTDEFVYMPAGFSTSDTGLSTDGGIFDPVGRRYTIGVRKTW